MAQKEAKPKGGLSIGSVPLGSALDVVDGIGSFILKFLAQRYEVEKKVDELKKETTRQVEEIRDEAIRTGYAVKKAFLRAIVEAIMLSTAILSLVLGIILLVKRIAPLEYVLIGYGLLVSIYIALTVKLAPNEK